MRGWLVILPICLLASLTGCERAEDSSSPSAGTPAAAQQKWSAEQIAKDPQGYLVWSDQQIEKQIRQRQERGATIAKRQAELGKRRDELTSNLDAVDNVRKRLEQAVRRAEDEDRWPVQMGGRKFERAKAREILDETARYLEDRRPLADEYDKAIARMSATDARLRSDVAELKRLRERLALDLERIRLRQGMEELDQLRKTEAELAAMSQMLSSEESGDLSLLTEQPPVVQTIDVETLLK